MADEIDVDFEGILADLAALKRGLRDSAIGPTKWTLAVGGVADKSVGPDGIVLGRRFMSDASDEDRSLVSREHVKVWVEGENLLAEDLGSTNGSVVRRGVEELALIAGTPLVLVASDQILAGQRVVLATVFCDETGLAS